MSQILANYCNKQLHLDQILSTEQTFKYWFVGFYHYGLSDAQYSLPCLLEKFLLNSNLLPWFWLAMSTLRAFHQQPALTFSGKSNYLLSNTGNIQQLEYLIHAQYVLGFGERLLLFQHQIPVTKVSDGLFS